jgi:hypothetical protein
MNREQIIEAILNHLINAREDGADRVYFGALTGREGSTDWETLGDLVDQLPASR